MAMGSALCRCRPDCLELPLMASDGLSDCVPHQVARCAAVVLAGDVHGLPAQHEIGKVYEPRATYGPPAPGEAWQGGAGPGGALRLSEGPTIQLLRTMGMPPTCAGECD